jgi:succinoglycan biosynthesis protein ExoA
MTMLPFVSVIIPCRNERRFIAPCLNSLLAGDYPRERLEILVADGMSDDGTHEVLLDYSTRHSEISVIENPRRIVPTGLNLAIQAARGEVIVRIDAHTEYAPDYISQCVAVLAETGADNVGGAARTKAEGYLPEAIALAYHSPFSAGGARFHNIAYEGYVDTVTYGCWRKARLLELGLFDEELIRNQDDELNLRIVRQGGRIWQSSRIRSWYYPRASLSTLFRQYAQYGYWKIRVIQKHQLPASWRHLVPGIWLAGMLLPALLSPFSTFASQLLVCSMGSYLAASLCAAVAACRQRALFRFIPVLPIVFFTYHLGYGLGSLGGVVDFLLLRRGGRDLFKQVTRDGSSSYGSGTLSRKLDKWLRASNYSRR